MRAELSQKASVLDSPCLHDKFDLAYGWIIEWVVVQVPFQESDSDGDSLIVSESDLWLKILELQALFSAII